MTITLLGTGTSTGVPMIGCDCAVCRSVDFRDKRLRTSVHVTVGDVSD
jgi:phosphoribosyl 1,2-cyclic phosphate phosphodiesterase